MPKPQKPEPTGAEFVAEVRRFLGRPYVYGAAGPNEFDCSGLVQYSLKQIGISAPRTSEAQFAWCEIFTDRQPQAGDLVFFVGAENDPPPGHVGVVVSPGVMIDAPHTGSFVQQTNFGTNGSGVDGFMGYGRVPGISGNPSTANQSLLTGPKKTGPIQSDLASIGGSVIGIIIVFFLLILVVAAIIVVVVILKH